MKTIFKLALISLLCVACSPDDPAPAPPPITPPTPGATYLSILPTISALQETKAGIITKFTDDDKIGIFATDGDLDVNYNNDAASANIPSTFFKDAWTVGTKLEIKNDGIVFAYYPYNKSVTSGKNIPIETASQTDYLYADKATISKTAPVAKLKMKHALALVSIRVRKNDYQHTGRLEKLEIAGLSSSGTLDISSGLVSKTGVASDVSRDLDITLDDNNLIKTENIVLPVNIGESPVQFKVTIDGEALTYDVPSEHKWEPGFEYIYTLNLSKVPEEQPEVEFEREYWEKFGKNDNIKIGSNNAYPNLTVDMGDSPYGKTLVKGEAYIFKPCLTNRNKTDFVGKIKLTLWDGNRMIEQFPAYNIIGDKNFFTTYNIPSYINCEPGTYKLIPLFQKEGNSEWFTPPYGGGVEEEDWMFTVLGSCEYPALQNLILEGEQWGGAVRKVNKNEAFNLDYTLSNRASTPLKGEIKAVFERKFTNEFRPAWENDGDTYEDIVGNTLIDIDSNTTNYKGSITCCITIARNTWAISGPMIHLYYKAEGTNTWVLMRSDADQELQRWKDIIGPDKMWIEKGFNYIQLVHPKEK